MNFKGFKPDLTPFNPDLNCFRFLVGVFESDLKWFRPGLNSFKFKLRRFNKKLNEPWY